MLPQNKAGGIPKGEGSGEKENGQKRRKKAVLGATQAVRNNRVPAMPYFWNYTFDSITVGFILIYLHLFTLYSEFSSKEARCDL